MDKKLIDTYLISLKNGNDNAFDEIYNLTKKGVFSVALGIVKNYQVAEDIMQDVFIKVKQKINFYKEGTNGYAWILTIARNLSINEYNKLSRSEVVDFQENEYLTETNDNLESVNMPIFKIAKKVLNQSELQIVLLYSVDGYKHREIAKIMNKPLGSVLWSYNNAMKKLKKELSKEVAIWNEKTF